VIDIEDIVMAILYGLLVVCVAAAVVLVIEGLSRL
jgi:hypothetical protein